MSPEEGRGRVVVYPARFAVVVTARVNAEMGPGTRVQGSVDLYPPRPKPPRLPSIQTVSQLRVDLL